MFIRLRTLFIIYSDSKNWFTLGNFFLVRSIAAQITKVKSWEIQVTKQSIFSPPVPSFKPLASSIDLIQDLQWPTLDEPVFVLSLGLRLFGLYYCLYSSGHALNQVSTNLLCTLSDPTFTYSKAHLHQQEGPHNTKPLPRVLPQILNRALTGGCAYHF